MKPSKKIRSDRSDRNVRMNDLYFSISPEELVRPHSCQHCKRYWARCWCRLRFVSRPKLGWYQDLWLLLLFPSIQCFRIWCYKIINYSTWTLISLLSIVELENTGSVLFYRNPPRAFLLPRFGNWNVLQIVFVRLVVASEQYFTSFLGGFGYISAATPVERECAW